MAAEEGETLESLLNKATSPLNRQEDWDMVMAFCDQVNHELEGPQISVRLLAHKIQSPQEREALYGLTVLEACVKNCGARFHQEIGKFRFLNEIIKVVSPKYLGNHTTERVKKRCIELMYSWNIGLKHESKVCEAYDMLKRQGIVNEDPVYVEQTFEPPKTREKNAVFEDEEKSKLLARLLKSKHPEDLQAANRLIKNMVKQDSDRIEKVSRRMQELETVENNIKVLSEMLAFYSPSTVNQSERDIMKELYDNLEKSRPNLFRLASDTDDKDSDGINEILKANDDMMRVMSQYKTVVEGDTEENGLLMGTEEGSNICANGDNQPKSDLEMLGDIFNSAGGDAVPPQQDNSLLSELMGPSPAVSQSLDAMLGGAGANVDMMPSAVASIPALSMTMSSQQPQTFSPSPFTSVQPSMGSQGVAATSIGSTAVGSTVMGPRTMGPTVMGPSSAGLQGQSHFGPQRTGITPSLLQNFTQPLNQPTQPLGLSQPIVPVFSTSAGSTLRGTSAGSLTKTTAAPVTESQKVSLDELDVLGQSLMKQSLAGAKSTSGTSSTATSAPAKSTTAAVTVHPAAPPVQPVAPLITTAAPTSPGVGTISPMSTPPVSLTSSPQRMPARPVEIQPLTTISVPLESIQPGPQPPHTAFDKNGIKIVFHFGKDRPRP